MYNLPDEEFDRLCREAADYPAADVPARGWDQMRQRLDREMPEDKERRRAWLLWIPFLVFLPISLFVWKNQAGEPLQASVLSSVRPETAQTLAAMDNKAKRGNSSGQSGDNKSSSLATNLETPPVVNVNQSLEGTALSTGSINRKRDASAAPGSSNNIEKLGTIVPPARNQETTEKRSSGTFNRVHKKAFHPQASRLLPSPAAGTDQVNALAAGRNATNPLPLGAQETATLPMSKQEADGTVGPGTVPPSASEKGLAHRSVSDGSNGGKTPASNAVAPGAAASLPTEKEGSQSASSKRGDAASAAHPPPSPNASQKQAQQNKSAPAKPVSTAERGISFSLVAGPDWSNVRFSAPDKMGLNAGLTIQYRLNKRLSVQTGLMYSRKHYTATDAEYPGYNTGGSNFNMLKVQANCFMWDIPFNLRLDVWSTPTHKAYIVAGVSSYLMSREDLHYYYEWNNMPRYKGWVNDTDKMYNLSEFNFAIGYERALSREWSVRLEPFIKLPLSSVGTGKVSLTSLGALAGITYTPLRLFKPTPKK